MSDYAYHREKLKEIIDYRDFTYKMSPHQFIPWFKKVLQEKGSQSCQDCDNSTTTAYCNRSGVTCIAKSEWKPKEQTNHFTFNKPRVNGTNGVDA